MCVINDATSTWQKEKELLEAEQKDSKKSRTDAVIEPTTSLKEKKKYSKSSPKKSVLKDNNKH